MGDVKREMLTLKLYLKLMPRLSITTTLMDTGHPDILVITTLTHMLSIMDVKRGKLTLKHYITTTPMVIGQQAILVTTIPIHMPTMDERRERPTLKPSVKLDIHNAYGYSPS